MMRDEPSVLDAGEQTPGVVQDRWRSEVRRRMELIRAGNVEWIDEEEILAELQTDT